MPKQSKDNKLQYINLIKKSPSKTLDYVFMSLTFILSISLIIFAVKPTIDVVLTVNKEIKEKQRVIESLNNKINALSNLDKQYLENEQKFEDLTLIYPTAGNFSLFLSNIDAVASRNSFDLKSVSFTDYDNDDYDVNASVLDPWGVRLSVTGKRSNFINLLKDLEAMPMYPVIDRISYSDDLDEDGNTSYSIALRIYHIDNKLFYE